MKGFVKILGTRGSVPVSGQAYGRYGGATCCVFLRLGGQAVVLDAGTGMLSLGELLKPEDTRIPLLLSHPHADHLLGLPLCPVVMESGREIVVYAGEKNGLGPKEQLCALMAPPLWPAGPEQLPAAVAFQRISEAFSLGELRVQYMEGAHPGGVTIFRLAGGGKSVVYLPDCNLQAMDAAQLADFARDCDLLLCDGQYDPAEWEKYQSFGHSTWEMAAQLGAACGAKQTRIIHHDPARTDQALAAAEAGLSQRYSDCTFAYEGEVIEL